MKRLATMPILLALMGAIWAADKAPAYPANGGLIAPATAKALLGSEKGIILLDVRTEQEFAEGHIEGALLLPYDSITAASAAKYIPAKGAKVIVYCRSGRRSAIAASSLASLGYARVWDMGGIASWPYGTVRGSSGLSRR